MPAIKVEQYLPLSDTRSTTRRMITENRLCYSIGDYNREIVAHNRKVLDLKSLIAEIGKEIKQGFFATINAGTGTATAGSTLQAACANLWAAIQAGFEDVEVEGQTVFFVNPLDAAAYLGTNPVGLAEAFGLQYVKNFLGMGTLIISKEIAQGAPVATVSDNIKGAYIGVDGELAVFGYSFDDTGLIGVSHNVENDRVSVSTNAVSGVKFYTEDIALVFKGSIA